MPFFSENEQGEAVTVNDDRKRDMLNEFLFTKIEEENIGNICQHTFMLSVLILYISGGTYSLNSTPNDKFFEKLFMAILFHAQSFCQKSIERKSPKKYFSYFVLMSRLGLKPWLFV